MSAGVVAPDDGAALLAGVVHAGTQRAVVVAFAGDARAQADWLDQLADVEEHHVTVSGAVGLEIVPVLLAVAEEDAGFLEALERADGVAVGDVVPVVLVALQVGDEQDLQAIRDWEMAQVIVGLLPGHVAEVQVGVACDELLVLGAEEERQLDSNVTSVPPGQVELAAGQGGFKAG